MTNDGPQLTARGSVTGLIFLPGKRLNQQNLGSKRGGKAKAAESEPSCNSTSRRFEGGSGRQGRTRQSRPERGEDQSATEGRPDKK